MDMSNLPECFSSPNISLQILSSQQTCASSRVYKVAALTVEAPLLKCSTCARKEFFSPTASIASLLSNNACKVHCAIELFEFLDCCCDPRFDGFAVSHVDNLGHNSSTTLYELSLKLF
ncbi:hypothetical protein BDU57DRAFT_209450 [Ampelomyces quisqualis]|uniref:Uncharacterized protein n=1 Tax=Ampelomyces quisqualis TaxID=50730 RepID=A0A6A5QM70_AMPQU|nr:hypothetical protein BDU57DRAFT_209450 [Ampelomyces quisqualis]